MIVVPASVKVHLALGYTDMRRRKQHFCVAGSLKVADVTLEEIIRPKNGGELFLYVNDAVLAWPSWWGAFYKSNYGTAQVTVKRERR